MPDSNDVMGDIAKGAAQGAALGTTLLPGIGTLIGGVGGALLSAFTNLAPSLGMAQMAGVEPAKLLEAAQAVAVAVTGKPVASAAEIDAIPPEQRAQMQVQLAEIAAKAAQGVRELEQAKITAHLTEIQAALADTSSAREQTVRLANSGTNIAYGAPVVSAIVLLTFGAVMALAFTRSLPDGSQTVLNMLLGSLAAMATSVVSYWVGSSASSSAKNSALADSVPSAVAMQMTADARGRGVAPLGR